MSVLILSALAWAVPNGRELPVEHGQGERTVFVILDGATLRVDGQVVAPIPCGSFLRVGRSEFGWYRTWWCGKEGWVDGKLVAEPAGAIACFSDAIRRTDKPEDSLCRATVWTGLGRPREAAEDCAAVLRKEPENAVALGVYGMALADLGEFDAAGIALAKAVRLKPDAARFWFESGRLRLRRGDPTGAATDFDESIRLGGDFSGVYAARAQAWLKAGAAPQAVIDFTEAVRLDPNSGPVENDLAWLLATCANAGVRDGKQAVRHAAAVSGRGQATANHLGTLAAAYAETGDFAKAEQQVLIAIDFDTSDDDSIRREMLAAFRQRRPWRQIPGKPLIEVPRPRNVVP